MPTSSNTSLNTSARTTHSDAFGFRVWRIQRLPKKMNAHTHPDIELNWIPDGHVAYEFAGKRVRILAGQLGIFWGGFPHHLTSHARASRGIWLTLPLPWFLRCSFDTRFTSRLMQGELLTFPLSPERPEQWLKDFTAGPSHHRLILLELEALFSRLALLQPTRKTSPRSSTLPPHETLSAVERTTAFAALHYQQPLHIEDLARHVKLHPKYLMAIFRKSTGITIKNYLLRLRIAHAQRLLATTRMSVLDIALHSGFGSLGRFYAAFATQLKTRPLQYRRLCTHPSPEKSPKPKPKSKPKSKSA